MSESWWKLFPSLVLKKLKAFDFISILSIRGRLNSASLHLKTLEKFVQPANENFTTFCKKQAYESWRKLFPTLVLKKLKAFAFICIVSIRGKLNSNPLYTKTIEKFVQPANENFTTYYKKHAYESWWKLFPTLVLKKLKGFCFHLHCIYKGKTKQSSKNLFNPQMKSYNILQKTHI